MSIITRYFASSVLLAAVAGVYADPPPQKTAPTEANTPTILTQTSTNTGGPRIQFATPVYDFGKVKAGEMVRYSYVFTNAGDAVLEVTHVQPSCGCTTAGEWTKRVEAGKTGLIPVQFDSTKFSGQVFKTVSVTSNDKHQPSTVLQLKGTIWKPIEFAPAYTILTIPPDAPAASTTVKIINNMDEPLELFAPQSSIASFTATLQTNKPGKEFQVTLSAAPPLNPGSLNGKIVLKSTSTNTPQVEVPFWANVQPAVMVLPQQLVLPAGPLSVKSTPALKIQNHSTNALNITEPSINIPGVEFQLKEMQPGKIFSVQLTFPEGFEIPPGQQVAFTAKSSNPSLPQIRVPVMQMPKPGTAGPLPPMPTPKLLNPQPSKAQPAASTAPSTQVNTATTQVNH
jgi:hypothetical protein